MLEIEKTLELISKIAYWGIWINLFVMLIALALFVMACVTGEVKQVLTDIARKAG